MQTVARDLRDTHGLPFFFFRVQVERANGKGWVSDCVWAGMCVVAVFSLMLTLLFYFFP